MKSARYLFVLLAALTVATAGLGQRSTSGRAGRILQPAPNAAGWHYGGVFNTSDYDCLLLGGGFSSDFIIATYIGYYGDPNSSPATPKVGDIYYTDLIVSNVAACQSAGVEPWLLLPANTSLAISATNPVYCFKNGQGVSCNQNPQLGVSLSGAYGYYLGYWPNLHGGNVEIQVPVSSSSPGVVTLAARVDTADGWNNPSVQPSVSYIVGGNSSSPTVSYPATPTTAIADTTATTNANVFDQNNAGTIYFDIGTSTTYEVSSTGYPVAASATGLGYYANWAQLNPGTLYHWRARFTYGFGSTALGADQTFTTTGTVSVPAAPQSIGATASSPTQVGVTWYYVTGATSYEVWRRAAGSTMYTKLNPTGPAITNINYIDTTAQPNTAYLYRVRAINSSGSSPDSVADMATTVIFNDDALQSGFLIKVAHLNQLRTAVNAVRALAGLSPGAYTDTPTAGVTRVKPLHVTELRAKFDEAMAVITGRNSSWATTPASGLAISLNDFQQLRDRLK